MIVIGASAGGVEATTRIVAHLPPDLDAAVLIAVHFAPGATSVLPRILERSGPLRASHAVDGEPIEAGHIYVAPPDRHLLVARGFVRVVNGPKENGVRPAADPLFRTAAYAYGPAVIGVVLSGNLNDGTRGLMVVRERGGVLVVQDPGEALYSGMPQSVMDHTTPDHVCRIEEIGPLLARLAAEPLNADGSAMTEDDDVVHESVMDGLTGLPLELIKSVPPSSFTCPECHGALWEAEDGTFQQFRCRVGHSFTLESLLQERSTEVEAALWTALTALEERIDLAQRLAFRMRGRGSDRIADKFEANAREARDSAALLRQVLRVGGRTPPEGVISAD